jgi:glycosyltransferase A (GT-A) superfamily protein (DUF2064 family)
LSATLRLSYPKTVPRRAVLVFADEISVDLERRSFPKATLPLLGALRSFEFSSEIDLHLFTSAADTTASGARVHRQTGRNFATRFENAIERITQLGYEEIVAVGRDCPGLCASDIEWAFVELASKKLVLGPDHRGGCYLIAFHSSNRGLLRGIRWKQNTDCAALRERCGEDHLFLLPVKLDLDSWADVRLFARSGDKLAQLAAFLLEIICGVTTRLVHFVSIATQQMRVRQQMPPPAFAA